MLTRSSKAHSRNGARLFAEYYFRAFDWGYATNDPYLVQSISGPACGACRTYEKSLRELRRHGGHVVGGRIRIVRSAVATGHYSIRSNYTVSVTIDEQKTQLAYPGKKTTTVERALPDLTSIVFVSWRGDRWVIIEVTNV